MCTVLCTTIDLRDACFAKDKARFLQLYNIFKDQHSSLALLWSIHAGWEDAIFFLVCKENVSLHPEGTNLLCEAIRFGQRRILNFLLNKGNFDDICHVPEIIEALHLAEVKQQHEIAIRLFGILLHHMTESVLKDKYNFELSENLKVYMRNRDYIEFTRSIREINYLQPVCV